MQIDWVNFTPYSALLGGVLIGLAVSMLALFLGRIAGISGIIGALIHAPYQESQGQSQAWRWAFLVGLTLAPVGVRLVKPDSPTASLALLNQPTPFALPYLILLAGLLVGFGARLGGGCTSGHGVCGLARGSKRALLATLLFMASAFVTTYCMRHLLN